MHVECNTIITFESLGALHHSQSIIKSRSSTLLHFIISLSPSFGSEEVKDLMLFNLLCSMRMRAAEGRAGYLEFKTKHRN